MKRSYKVGDNYSLVDIGADNVACGIRIEIIAAGDGHVVVGNVIASQGRTGYSVGDHAYFRTDTIDECGYPA